MKNAERWISGSVRSLLAQSYANVEIIVVDNGSTDASRRVVESVGDARVQLLAHPRGGVVSATNCGFAAATGRWIGRQDADDLSAPTRIEKQVALLSSRPEVSLVGCSHIEIDLDGTPLRDRPADCEGPAIRERLTHAMPFAGPSIVMRRELVEHLDGYDMAFDLRLGEDYDFVVRAAEMAELAAIAESLYWYRTNNPASFCASVDYDYRAAKALVRERALQRGSALFLGELRA